MRLLRGIVLLLSCAAVLVACSEPTGPVDEVARLERHRQLWAARGIDSYRMTVKLHGAWFGGAAVIEVRQGVPVSITHPQGGEPPHPEVFEHHDTVQELFAVVQHALERDAEHLAVKYIPSIGVPAFVGVDLRSAWADDEHGFSVERFRILK